MTTIKVNNPPELVIGAGLMAIRRPYISGGLVVVNVTKPCRFCAKPVSFKRGALFQGSDAHPECAADESKAQYEGQKAAVLNGLTESEYQSKYKRAWNE